MAEAMHELTLAIQKTRDENNAVFTKVKEWLLEKFRARLYLFETPVDEEPFKPYLADLDLLIAELNTRFYREGVNFKLTDVKIDFSKPVQEIQEIQKDKRTVIVSLHMPVSPNTTSEFAQFWFDLNSPSVLDMECERVIQDIKESLLKDGVVMIRVTSAVANRLIRLDTKRTLKIKMLEGATNTVVIAADVGGFKTSVYNSIA